MLDVSSDIAVDFHVSTATIVDKMDKAFRVHITCKEYVPLALALLKEAGAEIERRDNNACIVERVLNPGDTVCIIRKEGEG